MGTFSGVITLNSDLAKDTLVLNGDKESLAILLTLIDPALIISPKLANNKALGKAIKTGVKSLTIAIGDSAIPKDVLIEALKFCEVKK